MSTQKTIPVIGVPPTPFVKPKTDKVLDPAPRKINKGAVMKEMFNELTENERNAYYSYVKHNTEHCPEYKALTSNQKKRTKTEFRIEFLLNKDEMMKEWDKIRPKQVNSALPVPKRLRRKERHKKVAKNGPPPGLMDQVIEPPTEQLKPISSTLVPEFSEYKQEAPPGQGYQYLNSDWLQSSYTPRQAPTTSSEFSSFPSSSSYSAPSVPSFPTASEYSQQPKSNGYTPLMPELLTEANKVSSQGFFGQYSSQPSQYQQSPYQPESSQITTYPTILPSVSPALPSVPSAKTSELPLDFEAAVAMQQRLLQIEQELQDIERQKMEMAMSDELRRREEELKEKERTLARREKEFQKRERHLHRRRESRSRSKSREREHRQEYQRTSRPDYYQPEPQRSTYLTGSYHDYSSRPSTYQPPPQASYNSSEIRIKMRDRLREERDADAARRHGQKRKERRDGGEPLPGGYEAKRRGSSNYLVSSYKSGLPPPSRHSQLATEDISDDDY